MRDMRRHRQLLDDAEAKHILADPTILHGVLAVKGEGGYPYAAPISFAWADGFLWIHTACAGQRYDALTTDEHVCFTVVAADKTNEQKYSADFLSVIVFGRAVLVQDEQKHYQGLKALCDKYLISWTDAERMKKSSNCRGTAVWRIEPDRITGKIGSTFLGRGKHG